MNSHIAELELKKQRLAEMRKMREQREEEKRAKLSQTQNVNGSDLRGAAMTSQELDELLGNLRIATSTRHKSPTGAEQNNEQGLSLSAAETLKINGKENVKKRSYNLELVNSQSISIQPKNDVLSYCKTTQTDEERIFAGEFSMGSQELAFDDEMSLDENAIAPSTFDESPSREIQKHLHALRFSANNQNQSDVSDLNLTLTKTTKLPELSEEEKRQILSSSDFVRFFQQQARVIERAIAEDADIFMDYVNGCLPDDKVDKGEMLVLNREIDQGKVTENRFIRAMDYSTFYPELLAVAYDRNPELPLAPEGIVNVWNTRFKTSPEMTFHSSSQVTSMLFDEFQSNIIIGGCYSGQICIWDTRVNKRSPVCRTQHSLKAHTYPIFCMKMVGSQNAHDLVTVSTDGKLCSWSVDNLQAPIDSVNLICKTKKTVTALSMAFFHSDINNFVIGSEENTLYVGDRHGQKGELNRSINAHDMPITSVDLHHVPGSVDFSPLCISGSMDFSVKLWNLKDPNKNLTPLLSLERKHKFYVVDVKWSPVHPAVFVSASADGILNLWNLNTNIESAISTIRVSDSIRNLLWSKNGQQLTVGDGNGKIFIYDVHESLYNVRPIEWEDFAEVLTEMKIASGEQLMTS